MVICSLHIWLRYWFLCLSQYCHSCLHFFILNIILCGWLTFGLDTRYELIVRSLLEKTLSSALLCGWTKAGVCLRTLDMSAATFVQFVVVYAQTLTFPKRLSCLLMSSVLLWMLKFFYRAFVLCFLLLKDTSIWSALIFIRICCKLEITCCGVFFVMCVCVYTVYIYRMQRSLNGLTLNSLHKLGNLYSKFHTWWDFVFIYV